ncbi:MATE family efflux transporter [Salinigranum halophilum]|uniref:MATE family efflux transporter n=1 Tax=Salinigranum halophilum TaxID=2565931 RepID=UPI0010A82E56|nr:MATE family efflux transporter [Salinigranum halophilum]
MSVLDRLSGLFKSKEEFDLTSGGIGKPLFYLALPIVITNLLQTAYNLADTFWLGQYSTEALAAISFGFPLVFLLISFGIGISIAGSVLVAQYVGAGEEGEAEYAASQTMTFAIIASVVLGGVGYFLVEDILRLLGASPAVLPGATAYMQVISLGIVFLFGFLVFISLMRGYGDTITPMLVMFGSVAVNVIIDPFLIFGWWVFPELGIAGAAYATVFSRSLALVVGLGIMLKGDRGVRIRPRQMVPDLSYFRRILTLGGPASVEVTGRALSVNLLLVVVGLFSTTVVAAFGIGTRVFSVIFLPAIAVAQAVETMSGQNIGAGKPDRAEATADFAAKTMFLVLSAMGVVVFVFTEPIVAIFTTDPAVVDEGANFLRIVAPTFGLLGVLRAYSGSFRGAGKTFISAVIAISALGVVRLPVAWFGAQEFGPSGIWWSFVVSNAVGATIAFVWYKQGTWRDSDLTRSEVNLDDDFEGESDVAEAATTDD